MPLPPEWSGPLRARRLQHPAGHRYEPARCYGRSPATRCGRAGHSVETGARTDTGEDFLRMPAEDLGSIEVEQDADQPLPHRVVDVVDDSSLASFIIGRSF